MNVSPFCVYLVLAWHFQWHAVPAVAAAGALGYIVYALLWVLVVRSTIIGGSLRRSLAAILDQALPALGIYLAGPLAGLSAWVPALGAIGSGLRFGERYTWLSVAVGVPALSAAFFFSSYWQMLPWIATGLVLANVLLPVYVVMLVKRIEYDKRIFELRAAHFEAATKHDPLTGLLNRTGFADVLNELLASDAGQLETSAVLILDLDEFKTVNDMCGHAAGDDVLKAVAAALINCVRISDKVARLGGDEFGIVLCHIDSAMNAERIAQQIIGAVAQVDTQRDDLRLGASIGVCMLPCPELSTYAAILKKADLLMYEAKSAGKGQVRILSGCSGRDMN